MQTCAKFLLLSPQTVPKLFLRSEMASYTHPEAISLLRVCFWQRISKLKTLNANILLLILHSLSAYCCGLLVQFFKTNAESIHRRLCLYGRLPHEVLLIVPRSLILPIFFLPQSFLPTVRNPAVPQERQGGLECLAHHIFSVTLPPNKQRWHRQLMQIVHFLQRK